MVNCLGQQLLEKSADLPLLVNKMDLQDPIPLITRRIRREHIIVVPRVHIQAIITRL